MNGLELVGSGGVAGLALVAFYFVKLFVDARRRSKEERGRESASPLVDAASANATLRSTLNAVQGENARLVNRVEALEQELSTKDQRIDELEARVLALQEDLRRVAEDIGTLRHGKQGHG